jgi:hypothetical protein
MSEAKIYEFAVLYAPEVDGKKKQPERAKLVVDVQRIVAHDDQEAMILASRAIPEEYMDRLDRIKIAVRPF